jgi:hypothetical protein
MNTNVGRLDQFLRICISVALIYIGFIDENIIHDPLSSNIIGTVGVLFLIVALVRFCPLYTLTGINTCHKKSQ